MAGAMNNDTVDEAILLVGESWTQDSSRFLAPTMPRARTKDLGVGYSRDKSYRLGTLSNSLLAGGALKDWGPGIDPPVHRNLSATTVNYTINGRSTEGIVRALRRTEDQRFRDLKQNVVPIQLSECWQGMDTDLAALMIDEAFFTRIAFTGSTGAGLDLPSDWGNQRPDQDIDDNLLLLQPFRGFNGLALECKMSRNVLNVLKRHPAYSGGAALGGSGTPQAMLNDPFLEYFAALHGLDRVDIVESVGNSAESGQTAVIAPIFQTAKASAVLFFGLFDRRGEFDLTSEDSDDSPDGCIVLATGRDPMVANNIDERKEVEEFWGRTTYGLITPRADGAGVVADMGFHMKPATGGAAAPGIFDTA